ncbi:hypothetical protein K2173_012236 [Erythroxylum novogranatense]|uniref:PB1 domain-containing protein n=1 Tax=Erythroxylum novogranatense TaxID=1862640 RepID=A0AAV8S7A4_9ROSI|nr:hypothetical protein K2173_012236 [Erythroxylum novogranatense]
MVVDRGWNGASTNGTVKFLCSYGGRILPRPGDGMLRYLGGLTRVLPSIVLLPLRLMVKLGEFCGYSVELRCQLPNGDLETLISIKSDEELSILMQEYDRSSPDSKIRAVLSPPKFLKTVSPPSSVYSSETKSAFDAVNGRRCKPWVARYPVDVYGDPVTLCYYQRITGRRA